MLRNLLFISKNLTIGLILGSLILAALLSAQEGLAQGKSSSVSLNDVRRNGQGLTQLCNANPITIPSVGTAAPYPSTIAVAGLGTSTTNVRVTLNDANHTWRGDLDVLLVGPNGRTVMLMSEIGGGGHLINANITFDDLANSAVPGSGNITGNNTYLPTDSGQFGQTIGDMPAPAPVSPYGANFDQFLGANPNGIWNLYVYDDSSGDSGNINGGWCLDITTGAPLPGKLSFSSTSYIANEGAMEIVTVNRTGGSSGAVSVDFATSNGTAVAGSDYAPQFDNLSWNDGDNSAKTVSIPLMNDVVSEKNPETINLALANPTGGATLGSQSTSVGYIKDVASLYRNSSPIILPVVGAGNPYPSTITVSGAPPAVGRVRVSLFGITHGNVGDIDVLLVAPNGANFILMSDVASGVGGSNFTVTLEDAADTVMPPNTAFNPNFNLKPTNYSPLAFPLDDFSIGGGPSAPYGNPGPGLVADTFSSKFDGMNPNGDWKLYVVDDTNGISGVINGGWAIDFVSPTAAESAVSGKVVNLEGQGVFGALVEIIGGDGIVRSAMTNSFGFYRLDGLAAGQTYVINIRHKTLHFSPQVVTVFGDLQNIDFTAISAEDLSSSPGSQ